jgi:hypothetical protein
MGSFGLVYRLTVVLAALLMAASVIGLLYGRAEGFYDRYPAALSGLLGQDVVTLVVGIPVLLGSMWMARRGSLGGLLVWVGSLFYFAYTYYFFVVGGFTPLFPVHVAIVALGLFGTVALLLRSDPAALRARFEGVSVRPAAGLCIGFAVFFALFWGGLVVSVIASGDVIDRVLHEVVAIDGAVMLPLLFFGGVKLWRREPFGYVLGGLLLTKLALTGFTLSFTTLLGVAWTGSIAPLDALLLGIFAVMGLSGIGLLIPYLRSIADGHSEPGVAIGYREARP